MRHSKVKNRFILVLEGVVPAVAFVVAKTPCSLLMVAGVDFLFSARTTVRIKDTFL